MTRSSCRPSSRQLEKVPVSRPSSSALRRNTSRERLPACAKRMSWKGQKSPWSAAHSLAIAAAALRSQLANAFCRYLELARIPGGAAYPA